MFAAKYRGYDIDLYRSTHQRWFAGVCGGIAENMHWSATGVRICAILLFFFTGPMALLGYILAVFMLASQPVEKPQTYEQTKTNEQSQFCPRSKPNLKQKMFDYGTSASGKINEIRDRLVAVDQRIRAMEEHVTSRKFQFERAMRHSR